MRSSKTMIALLLVAGLILMPLSSGIAFAEESGQQTQEEQIVSDQSQDDTGTGTNDTTDATLESEEDEDQDDVATGDEDEDDDSDCDEEQGKSKGKGKGKGALKRPITPKGLLIAKENVPEHVRERFEQKIQRITRSRELALLYTICEMAGITVEEAEAIYSEAAGDLNTIAEMIGVEKDELEDETEDVEEELLEEELDAELEEDADEILDEESDDEDSDTDSEEEEADVEGEEELQEEIAELQEEITSEPDNVKARAKLAMMLKEAGRLDEALEVAEGVESEDALMLKLQAQLHQRLMHQEKSAQEAQKHMEQAMEKFRRALEQEPNVAALVNMAALGEEAQNYDEAVGALKEAFKLDPKAHKVYAKLGQLMRTAEKYGVDVPELPVFIDGSEVEFDVEPEINNGSTMVPIRKIAEALGAEVGWNAENRRITISKDDQLVEFVPGTNVAYVNGEMIELASAIYISQERTLVPVRLVSEALDTVVEWNGQWRTIKISSEEEQTAN